MAGARLLRYLWMVEKRPAEDWCRANAKRNQAGNLCCFWSFASYMNPRPRSQSLHQPPFSVPPYECVARLDGPSTPVSWSSAPRVSQDLFDE